MSLKIPFIGLHLRTFIALPEDLSLVPGTQVKQLDLHTNHLYLQLEESQ